MQEREAKIKVWDLPLRLFHWLLVASIALAFLSSEEDSAFAQWHEPAGWIAAVLIAFRIAWGFVGGEHARFASFLRPADIGIHLRALKRGRPASVGHNPAGGFAAATMLALVAAVVGLGVGAASRHDLGEVHEVVAYALLAMIGLHVLAVISMSILSRENLVRAMITGNKPAANHPGARDARPPPWPAIPLAAVAIMLATYGATRLDVDAFRPGPRADDHGDMASPPEGGAEEDD